MSVATALESDLEPFSKLKRFVLKPPSPSDSTFPPSSSLGHSKALHPSSSLSDLHKAMNVSEFGGYPSRNEYTLSTNPPNPRTSFRLGDWICASPNCAAHNFGRNLSCIGCGCPRSNNSASNLPNPTSRATPSPRFTSFNSANQFMPTPATQDLAPILNIQRPNNPPASHAMNQRQPSHPLLTPSGKAFAVGGRVQNISSDPLSPCIMYWPDNEPLPEQGQIRPSGLAGVPQPPILNTGNRGPITHQPGDWICQKCNYLNWRRRKVCQTCLPYAEGNGDSVSAAVQAERIALLTSVLSQTRLLPPSVPPTPANRSHSLTPPQVRRNLSASPSATPQGTVHRSHSHLDLGTQYSQSRPIYQTSGHRQATPLYSTRPTPEHHLDAPAPLLPSFLVQDIAQQVPALSPSSTGSADLSLEEYDGSPSPTSGLPLPSAIVKSPMGNIWRMDGEESKSLSPFSLPNRQTFAGNVRKPSHEKLRLQVISS
ncbi:hypothetical protein BDN72DRAFT_897005 [Pluteus cervinus]|uniref:Uncharacterized protein n=1 Tax=Pluteus cervinus TaxID=181527 RepID=A0ACD3AVL8_9AGAR|nr:hypothetical protein BDN72DRAFT_897005 [Pluteus cervinus]